ncbi:MAG: hypothetical protein N2652_00905 [Kiritimatiellae bacterium]|nr:hypothetical protein [Kiritimatiellia bacterium]
MNKRRCRRRLLLRPSGGRWVLTGLLHIAGAASSSSSGEPGSLTTLVFEAETVSSPTTAWTTNRSRPDRWNLWSTDSDAQRKWSGGVVLQSPPVRKDRASADEGAPPLHTRIEHLPPGRYDVVLRPTRPLAVSLDGREWRKTTGGVVFDRLPATNGVIEFWVDDRFADPANPGAAYYDTVTLVRMPDPPAPVRVEGWARRRPIEPFGRGLTAVRTAEGIYVSWRLLAADPPDLEFELDRGDGGGPFRRLTPHPVRWTTGWLDSTAPTSPVLQYRLRVAGTDRALAEITVAPDAPHHVALSIPLRATNATFHRCAVADLDGDGTYDFVVKIPAQSIDPYESYWKPSPGTYSLEAYLANGRHLWSHDLGWSIEQGIWYSPFVAFDLDGDGRAEVVTKAGEGDPRGPDGRVRSGPEWLVVLDGLTGRERARAPWPDRSGFGDDLRGYNYASRNQIAIAFLDGRTPCVLALRGTYTLMKADAYDFDGRGLRLLWSYHSDHHGQRYRGQGGHFTRVFDLDDDGRDEVILGSVALDDTGVPLWCTGLGHPDAFYLGDLWPSRPGAEIFYVVETRQPRNGLCMADARTGRILWGLDRPTRHVHSIGLGADVDARWPGAEGYGADSVDHKPTGDRWFFAADGTLIATNVNLNFGKDPVWWDADLQRELVVGRSVQDHDGTMYAVSWQGEEVMIADILGDWREEIIVSEPGWLRVYSTSVPAFDRRLALMLNPLYRLDVAMASMGYTLAAGLPFDLERQAPNVNLTVTAKGNSVRIVVSAPTNSPLVGEVHLELPAGLSAAQCRWPVSVPAGERIVLVTDIAGQSKGGSARAILARPGHAEIATVAAIPPRR